MTIDDTTHPLPYANFKPIETLKEQIILANTFNHDMRHVIGWKHRNNGEYKKTAAFTITTDGVVYQHFDPKFYSSLFTNHLINLKSIVILLENDGWLTKDLDKNRFITWVGDIYNGPIVFEKKWRGHEFWSPYTEKQQQSVLELVRLLCSNFNIPLTAISHNTKIDNIADYKGVLYRSNLERHYTDLNPSWDFESFKNKIESYD